MAPSHFSPCPTCLANPHLLSVKIKTSFALPLHQELDMAEEKYKPGHSSPCNLDHHFKKVLMRVFYIPSPWMLPQHLFLSLQTSSPEPSVCQPSTLLLSPETLRNHPPYLCSAFSSLPSRRMPENILSGHSGVPASARTTKPLLYHLCAKFSSFPDDGVIPERQKMNCVGNVNLFSFC